MAGPAAVSYAPAQNLVNQQTTGFNNLLNKQDTEQTGLFNQYNALSNSQPKLVDVLNNAQQQAGIGGLQQGIDLFNQQSTGVKGLLDNLNQDTQARTTGTNASQAYLDRMREVEGGNLNTQLSRLTSGLGDVTNAYNTANANTGQLLSATQADQATALHPLELQINSLSDKYARQITGFTTNAQNALNVLLTKIGNQQDLNNKEWQQAADLAKQEAAFQQQRQLAADASKSNADVLKIFNGQGYQGAYAPKNGQSGAGGFSFTNASGSPISANQFAQQNKIPLGSLLYKMGQSGDQYAAQAYNEIQANQQYYNQNPNVLQSEFKALF